MCNLCTQQGDYDPADAAPKEPLCDFCTPTQMCRACCEVDARQSAMAAQMRTADGTAVEPQEPPF